MDRVSPCQARVKALSSAACAVFGATVLATVVSAQTLPLPTLPPEPPPETGTATSSQEVSETEGAAFSTSRDRWEYNVGVGATYDNNIGFRVPEGPSRWAISPRGRLDRVFTSLRGDLILGGRGSWYGYPEQSELDRFTAGLYMRGGYRSSLDTEWHADASYDLNYSDSSEILTDQGVLLPLVRTRTAAGSLGLTTKLGLRTSFVLDARITYVQFDQQDALARGLVDGQHLRGTAALERRLGQHDSGTIAYSLGATLAGYPTGVDANSRSYYLTHFGSLRWNHVLSSRSAFLLEGGASYTPESEEAGLSRRVNFYGGVTYRRQVRRSDLMLFVRREVTPAFGLGVSRVQTRFGVHATVPMGRWWTLQMGATHSILETPEGAPFTYGTPDEAYMRLGRRLGRHFSLSGEGRYRRRGAAGAIPAVDAYQVGLFLSLSDG